MRTLHRRGATFLVALLLAFSHVIAERNQCPDFMVEDFVFKQITTPESALDNPKRDSFVRSTGNLGTVLHLYMGSVYYHLYLNV